MTAEIGGCRSLLAKSFPFICGMTHHVESTFDGTCSNVDVFVCFRSISGRYRSSDGIDETTIQNNESLAGF
jgi:hypothetical protein